MSEYKLTLGDRDDLTLNRLANELGVPVSQVLIAAINTYATLKRNAQDDTVYFRHKHNNGRLIVKRLVIP